MTEIILGLGVPIIGLIGKLILNHYDRKLALMQVELSNCVAKISELTEEITSLRDEIGKLRGKI